VKRALISDIHGNFEALCAVLEDIRNQDVSEIFCLGDIVGYGPNPCECLDAVIKCSRTTILGNHDQATLFDPDGFNPVALQAIYWTRQQLDNGPGGQTGINRRWDFLGELPRLFTEGRYLFVHGSPREPTNEYVFPEDVFNQRKMDALFGRIEQYCFQGHTHIPGIFTTSQEFITPEECRHSFKLGTEKAMINVGSVGQPRDGDPRSAYAIYDMAQNVVELRRVEYDIPGTQRKILAAGLPARAASRLEIGR
jgi:diadenosine tetraphosphatase ApaH/serine/threonine PP2A family protein phosphatase